jgi:Spy/CpxP family protein refolding chaperone
MKTWIKRSLLAVGVAAAVGAGGAFAQGMHGGPGGHMLERAEALRKDLALTDSQQSLWDIAMNKSKAVMQAGKQAHKQGADRAKAQLATGNADLRALAAEMDAQRDAMKAQHLDARNAWLNLYDKLDTAQRGKVNAVLAQMMERRGRMMERHGGQGSKPGSEE